MQTPTFVPPQTRANYISDMLIVAADARSLMQANTTIDAYTHTFRQTYRQNKHTDTHRTCTHLHRLLPIPEMERILDQIGD